MTMRTLILLSIGCCLAILPERNAKAQCRKAFRDSCVKKLKDYAFLKTYKIVTNPIDEEPIEDARSKFEYTYVFSRGTQYKLNICSSKSDANKVIVNLYNSDRKLLASSYNENTATHYEAIGYQCTATDRYYLSFYFSGKESGCDLAILGFKRGVSADVKFFVQLAASKTYLPKSHKVFTVKNMEYKKGNDGYIRYSLGPYKDINIADRERSRYFNKGFKGAFILTFYKGKRITAKEGISITSED